MNSVIITTASNPSSTVSPDAPTVRGDAVSLLASTGSFRAAFDATAADRAALTTADLIPINLDIAAVTTTVLSAVVQVRAIEKDIAAALAAADIAGFAKLETYAEALAYAQSVYLAASAPIEVLPALTDRAIKVRQQLFADASALALRGLLDPHTLATLKGINGYMNLASDLSVLVQMFRERWTEVASKSGVVPTDLDEAERLAEQITRACAARAGQPKTVAAASDDRQRAYALVLRAHDEARRAVGYVRWHLHDADKLVPSLWAGRGGRGTHRNDANANGANGGGADPNGANAATNGINDTTPSPVSPTPPVVEPVVEPGHPGGSPFANN